VKENLLTGLLLLQTAGLVGALGWLVANPVQALPDKPRGPSVLRPHRASGAAYASEAEAAAAWVGQLDRVFELEVVLGGGADLEVLKRTRGEALSCQVLACPALDAYANMARATSRPVPPRPAWDGAASDLRRAVALYVDDLQGRLEVALAASGDLDLLPRPERIEAARDCESFDCEALDAYLITARHAFKVLGEPLPEPKAGER